MGRLRKILIAVAVSLLVAGGGLYGALVWYGSQIGDPAFFDILHSYNGYRTCYYRTFAVGSASSAQKDAYTRAREYIVH